MPNVEIIKPKMNDPYLEKYLKESRRRKRVCAYCRVSTDLEEQKTSYASQISHYTDYIKQNKEWEFVGIYADEGISGTQVKNRTEFQRMIEDCKMGKIDIIIAKSISRFARNTVDTLNIVRLLRSLGIDVYFEKENIHTLNMDSEMFLTLYSAFAQAESESTSMNVKLGYVAKMKRGEACGTIAPYGFDWDKNTKEMSINEEESKVVKLIFDLYLEGLGSTRIAKKLINDGIPAPLGGKIWHAGVIKDILKNEKYVGDLCSQKSFVVSPITHKAEKNRGQKPKYYVREHHEGIIDRNTWEKARQIYDARSIKMTDGKTYCKKFSLRYTFSSRIYCKCCNQTYVRRTTKYTNNDGITNYHIYWQCGSKVSKKACPEAKSIKDEELKLLFVSLYNKLLYKYRNEDVVNQLESIIMKNNNEVLINNLEKKINTIKDKISKLIDLNINGNINNDVFEEKNKNLAEQLQQAETEKKNLEKNKHKTNTEKSRINKIKKELNKNEYMKKFEDEIFNTLVDKIEIGEYDKNNNYVPNVIKFILKLKNNNLEQSVNFLSLRDEERLY